MSKEDFWERVGRADKILVGLGEEFDNLGRLRGIPEYIKGCRLLEKENCSWAIPVWNLFWNKKMGDLGEPVRSALRSLFEILEGEKRSFRGDYFVVSTALDRSIVHDSGRVVMPCGSSLKKQCSGGCKEVLQTVTDEELELLLQGCEEVLEGSVQGLLRLGKCPDCGENFVLNNIHAPNYQESGYLEQWNSYTKWLQGTLNRSCLVLELGVGMQHPTVIRWPFEKIVYFNKKAYLYRVNEKLYQLTEELSGKGCGISMNAIDWLNQL